MEKSDFLQECMGSVGNIPIDQFNLSWCSNCQNIECARSGASNMKFSQRVLDWRNTLFKNPARANENDGRYDDIRKKNFTPINKQPSYEVKSFSLPVVNNLGSIEKETKVSNVPQRFMIEVSESKIDSEVEVEEKTKSVPDTTPSEQETAVFDLQNTEFTQGMVLPGKPNEEPKEIVEKPGSSFVFGDD